MGDLAFQGGRDVYDGVICRGLIGPEMLVANPRLRAHKPLTTG